MALGYTAGRTNTRSEGLWPLAAEPGPGFRWGIVKRRSAYERRLGDDGNVELYEESTARQEDASVDYVEKHELGKVVAEYTDIASAYKEGAKRPQFDNALEDVRAGRIDGIIVWKLDRLTRRKNQMRRILTLLEDCGGRLFSVVEGVDTADPNKREITELVLNVYIGAAEAESRSISERVRLMHLDLARKGRVLNGSVRPFGHTEDLLHLVPTEVEILHEAGDRALVGEAMYSIARDFTRRRIETTTGKTHWHPEVLTRMLTHPRMIGMREYGGELFVLNDVPPVFDRETWERICVKLTRTPRLQAPSEEHLLSNIALCDNCLHPVRGGGRPYNGSASRVEGAFTYRCRPRIKGSDEGNCGRLSIVGHLADEEVSRRVVAWIANRENITNLLYHYAEDGGLVTIQARIAELTESRKALSKALTPPPGVPRMPMATYYERAKEIEAERAALGRRLAVTREAGMLAELLEVEDMAAEWHRRPLRWRREILRLVTLTILIERRGKGVEGQRPQERKFDPNRIKMQFAV